MSCPCEQHHQQHPRMLPCQPGPALPHPPTPTPADLLLGRADSGMCWLFDLSERLGWADGSHAGSWLRAEHAWHGDGSDQARSEAGQVGWLAGPQAGTAAP